GGGGFIFKISPDGTAYTVLRELSKTPRLLMIGRDGALYGTADDGGPAPARNCCQVDLFKLNTDGSGYAVLHTWTSLYPTVLVTDDQDGTLYGAAKRGDGSSTVFKLGADGWNYC